MNALEQPWNIGMIIATRASAHGERDAIVAEDIRINYRKLWQIAQAFAVNMRQHGIRSGVTVALDSHDMIASVGVMIATALLGASFVLYNQKAIYEPGSIVILYSPDRPTPVAEGMRIVLISADWSPRNSVVDPSAIHGFSGPDRSEASWWTMHTSGTTGHPKALVLSYQVAFDRSIAAQKDFLGEATRFCPLFPCYTRPFFVRAMAALVNGSTILDGRDPAFLSAEGANLFCGSPRQVHEWLTQWRVRQRFLRVQVSGAPFSDEAALEMFGIFDIVEDVYGSSETNKSFVNRRIQREGRVERIGFPQDSLVELLSVDGRVCSVGEVGEVRVRNGYMVDGYVDDPVSTARAFREGWFYPGDLGRWEADGALRIIGRVDQIINLDGTKIDPAEIEQLLQTVDGVHSAAVFLDPSENVAERTMAFLVLDKGADVVSTVQAAIDLSEKKIGSVKAPGYFFVVPDIPMTHDGVPRRGECARIARTLPRNV